MSGWRDGLSSSRLISGALGVLFLLAGMALVAMTSRGLIDYRQAASRHGGEVLDLGAEPRPTAGQHGQMARVVGVPRVVEAPHDPDFNQSGDTPVLVRQVEMFQWREVRVGSGVHYELDWVDRPLDSSHFEEPRGHRNPARFPLGGKQFDAGLVQLGGFRLGPALLHALPGTQRLAPDMTTLPPNLAASFSLHDDYLITSARPGEPRLGDVRISWAEVPLQQVTVVARLDGDGLVAASEASDGKGYEVQVGDVPVLTLFPDLPVPPGSVWLQWLLSVVLAVVGCHLLLLARRAPADVLLALGSGTLLIGVIAGVLWLGNDGGTAGGWLALAALGLILSLWRLRRQA